ncbi:cobalt-precorrin-6A reductase [Profundibacterium mesophilum]|uniref:Precorrin-6A reductase n=1 Tax=Profundibacterium mesophilum KAUST100406-0324 TaxID=1037889 RepID=A0A921NRQ9_9RHOB|nr:cobalt-precorrin-6A reductase [Profundibacterium mesophilum]KAF0677512.1 Precorrin-6A reductase [Profundibacterium mesophilum KAUST100406-0324]
MPEPRRLLLLAGSTEARVIGQALARRGRSAIASLAGDTRAPADLGLPLRIGGFGSAHGFADFLASERIGAVIDATHPHAARMGPRSFAVCAEMGLPYLRVLRPPWQRLPGDLWHDVAHEEDVAALVAPGARVFLATGRKTLHAFAGMRGRTLFCRQIEAPRTPFPFEGGRFVVGRPPFSIAQEVALFEELAIDWLVMRNAGGDASRSKLDAARQLGIRIAMIARPPRHAGALVETAQDALTWSEEIAQ